MGRTVRIRCLDGEIQTINGVLVPYDGAPPDRSVGTTVERARAVVDVSQPPIARCLAARVITPAVLADLVSPTYGANLRRVARRVHPSLIEACRELPMRALLELAGYDGLEDQRAYIRRWELLQIDRAGVPRHVRGRRPRAIGARDKRIIERLIDQIGPRNLKRIIDGA